MAMMRFNKIRLPGLPEVDRTTYPYAYITTNEYDVKYYLYFSPVALIATTDADGNAGLIAPDELDVLGLSGSAVWDEDTEWTELAECTISASEPILYPVWSDTDVYYVDETLYLPSSEPVESDIMYYYNEAYLPALPPWNTDYYPFAFITQSENGNALLRFTHEPLWYVTINNFTELYVLNNSQDEFTYGMCVLMSGGTVNFDPEQTYSTAIGIDASTKLVWSNYDIRDIDSLAVIKEASEPTLEYVPPDDGGDTGEGGDSGDSGESGDTTLYVCSDWRIPFILGLFAPFAWNTTTDERLTWATLEALALLFGDIEGIAWDEFEFYK